MVKILVIDDQEAIRAKLKDILIRAGYEVVEASDGKAGKKILETTFLDLVISDINMPALNGLELLTWLNINKWKIPVILMTGQSSLIDAKVALDFGASAFLPKPFRKKELFEAINLFIKGSNPLPVDSQEGVFYRISLDDFICGHSLPYSIYLRSNNGRYMKVAHSGEDLTLERIEAFRKKNVEYFYFTKEDFSKYLGLGLTLSKTILENRGKISLSQDKKVNLFKHTAELITQKIHMEGVDQEGFKEAETLVFNALEIISQDSLALGLLDLLNVHSDFLYSHSVGVALFGAMLAKKSKLVSTRTLYQVTLGGLFHNIGLKEIPRETLDKAPANRTFQEKAIYETHPTRGKDILRQVRTIPDYVVQIAYQHHEKSNGTGYPQGLSKGTIFPLALLIQVVDVFCELTLKSPYQTGIPGKEALEVMKKQHEYLDPKFFLGLERLFI